MKGGSDSIAPDPASILNGTVFTLESPGFIPGKFSPSAYMTSSFSVGRTVNAPQDCGMPRPKQSDRSMEQRGVGHDNPHERMRRILRSILASAHRAKVDHFSADDATKSTFRSKVKLLSEWTPVSVAGASSSNCRADQD